MIDAPIMAAGDLLEEVQALRDRLIEIEAQVRPVWGTEARPALLSRQWVRRLAGVVADEWGVSSRDVTGTSRLGMFIRPRFVLVWLLRETAGYSYPVIAQLTGYTDHTSVMHAHRRVVGWRRSEDDFRYVTDQLLVVARRLRGERPPAALAAAGAAVPPAAAS